MHLKLMTHEFRLTPNQALHILVQILGRLVLFVFLRLLMVLLLQEHEDMWIDFSKYGARESQIRTSS